MEKNKNVLPFDKANFKKMGLCIAVILLGFIVMSLDKETFGFGTLGLVIGPIITVIGFGLGFYAILSQTPEKSEESKSE